MHCNNSVEEMFQMKRRKCRRAQIIKGHRLFWKLQSEELQVFSK
jgi:hypothetical protein